MKATSALSALALLTGCSNPFVDIFFEPDPTMEVSALDEGRLVTVRLADSTTTRVRIMESLDDPKGFAGLEVVVEHHDMPRRTFTAPDFAANRKPKFKVPDGGAVTVTARIVQNGRIVAEASGQWWLEKKAQWEVEIDRAPFPKRHGLFVWSDAVDEGAANYEGEVLWVSISSMALGA